jgi:hypothetical protein
MSRAARRCRSLAMMGSGLRGLSSACSRVCPCIASTERAVAALLCRAGLSVAALSALADALAAFHSFLKQAHTRVRSTQAFADALEANKAELRKKDAALREAEVRPAACVLLRAGMARNTQLSATPFRPPKTRTCSPTSTADTGRCAPDRRLCGVLRSLRSPTPQPFTLSKTTHRRRASHPGCAKRVHLGRSP